MAQQSEFIEIINIDSLKIIKLHALYTALGATINSNIIYFVKLRLSRLFMKKQHGMTKTKFKSTGGT
jgi:phosphoglycerate-specific signal transduction histidine kinase